MNVCKKDDNKVNVRNAGIEMNSDGGTNDSSSDDGNTNDSSSSDDGNTNDKHSET